MNRIIYGCAYYDEYMPYERIDKDIAMMKKAGINTVRIAESTWSTEEPHEGIYDFSSVVKVMDKMEAAGIDVIIGTPTYAIPYWLAQKYPEVMADTSAGKMPYGARQLMDITAVPYRNAAEALIRKLMEITCQRKCVIGYQIDNETKYYDAANEGIHKAFVNYLRNRFDGSLDALNKAFGLSYWSNLITDWNVFPDVRGSINGSLKAEFDKFRRTLVDDFLAWQADLVNQYRRPDQFITHNFDFEWRGYSFGIQPMVNHFHAAKPLTLVGCDIYHPTQDDLTGAEIAFCGDVTRSLKHSNYIILETEAHGFPNWMPYDGQLRLQAYSHLASGANGINYWHWHSIHNSAETYWMGILGHDFEEGEVYRAVCQTGCEFRKYGSRLVNLRKTNRTAILVSNESLSALNYFPIDMDNTFTGHTFYNDILRWVYDTLYRMNIECDFITPETENLSAYQMIVMPALYDADDDILQRLDQWVKDGGTLIGTFKSAYANEDTKVYPDRKPHLLHKAFGMHYNEFTFPRHVKLLSADGETGEAEVFIELLINDSAETLFRYVHPSWGKYSAVTKNRYGSGCAYYIGTKMSEPLLVKIIESAAQDAGIELNENRFPLIVRKGMNDEGKEIQYFMNYSPEQISFRAPYAGVNLLQDSSIEKNDEITLEAWSLCILES